MNRLIALQGRAAATYLFRPTRGYHSRSIAPCLVSLKLDQVNPMMTSGIVRYASGGKRKSVFNRPGVLLLFMSVLFIFFLGGEFFATKKAQYDAARREAEKYRSDK